MFEFRNPAFQEHGTLRGPIEADPNPEHEDTSISPYEVTNVQSFPSISHAIRKAAWGDEHGHSCSSRDNGSRATAASSSALYSNIEESVSPLFETHVYNIPNPGNSTNHPNYENPSELLRREEDEASAAVEPAAPQSIVVYNLASPVDNMPIYAVSSKVAGKARKSVRGAVSEEESV